MEFRQTQKFSKELKRLGKKYRTLPSDLEKLQAVLNVLPQGNGSKHWNRLHVSSDGRVTVFKVRLSCAAMKGESAFRIVYAHRMDGNGTASIDFIELYYKGEQAIEDQALIRNIWRRIEDDSVTRYVTRNV